MPVTSSNDNPDKARRFRDAALPYLDDVYTLARYLLRDPADAEDAVQECYLRALKHFDSYDAVGAPVGTVMSRLARARSMLRSAWLAEEEQPK